MQPPAPTPPSDAPPAGADRRTTVVLAGRPEFAGELRAALRRLGMAAEAAGPASVAALIEQDAPPCVVLAGGPADLAAVASASASCETVPDARAARIIADAEALRRLAADELGLPTAPFWFASSAAELAAVAAHAGYPLVVKPMAAADVVAGKSVLLRDEDVEPAWDRAVAGGDARRVMAESVVEVDFEVMLLTVRGSGPTGSGVQFCEPIGHRRTDDEVLESWQPQEMSSPALDAAKSIAARMVNALGGRGLFGVELLVRGDEVYFSGVDPHPFDTALVTLRSQRLSVFDLCARAVLALPADTIMVSPGAAELIYAGAHPTRQAADDAMRVLADALATAESDVLVFAAAPGDAEADATAGRSPRRRAVALATAPDVIRARDRVRHVAAGVRKLW